MPIIFPTAFTSVRFFPFFSVAAKRFPSSLKFEHDSLACGVPRDVRNSRNSLRGVCATIDELRVRHNYRRKQRAHAAAGEWSLTSTDTELNSNWFLRRAKLKIKSICFRSPCRNSEFFFSFFSSLSKPSFHLFCSVYPRVLSRDTELSFKQHCTITRVLGKTWLMMYQI